VPRPLQNQAASFQQHFIHTCTQNQCHGNNLLSARVR
jgi:hypothetical protein